MTQEIKGANEPASVYDESVNFIVEESPERFAHFQTTPKMRERVWDWVRREKNDELIAKEKAELDTHGQIEHLMRLAKARARMNIAHAI